MAGSSWYCVFKKRRPFSSAAGNVTAHTCSPAKCQDCLASCLGRAACSLYGSWTSRAHSNTMTNHDLCCTLRQPQPHTPGFLTLAPAPREQHSLRAQLSALAQGFQSPRHFCSPFSETLILPLLFFFFSVFFLFFFFKQGTAMELRLALSAPFSCLSLRSAVSQVLVTTPSSNLLLKGHRQSFWVVWPGQGRVLGQLPPRSLLKYLLLAQHVPGTYVWVRLCTCLSKVTEFHYCA